MVKNSVIFLYVAFAQALLATGVSLFYSEIMHLPPCVLCWYQRILMYPLVIILTVGILRKDKGVSFYVFPFAFIGIVIALYHTLLQYGVIPESAAPCIQGISCTTKLIAYFGFITIPLLSLIAFLVITSCMLMYWWYNQKHDFRN